MGRRLLAACVVLFVAVVALPAAAQSDSGEIRIVVNDDTGKQPLSYARVVLDGPVIASELTGVNGQVLFTDVPDGIYHARIAKGGYQTITSQPFEVINGNYVTVSVQLALSTQLKVIGTVTAKSSATISASSIGPDSAQRKLSSDLADALNKLSGVSVSLSGDDNSATQTVSLNGEDPSQTQLTLDGIPMNAPGSAGDLGMFATDLFSGASVHQGPQMGGLAGGVNFTTLQPTLSWMSQAQLAAGSFGRYNYSVAESGSFDKLGLALQTTYRSIPSLADGMTYLDASGFDYSHEGDSSIWGNLAKFRYQFGDSQTVTGTFLNSTRNVGLLCLRITQTIPCGYGPNNSMDSNVQLYSLQDSALMGETLVQASVYSNDISVVSDELNRYVDGEAQPIGFINATQSHGFTVNATLPAKLRHTISIQAYGTWSGLTTTPLVPQAVPYYNGSQGTSYSALQVTDAIQSNDKLQLTESVGVSNASNANAGALGTVGFSWKPTKYDQYSFAYTVGGVAASPGRNTILTDPESLRWDCTGNIAYGNAPGDQPGRSSSTDARLNYTRSLRGGQLTFSLYKQVQNDVVLPVQVNGSVLEQLGVISPAYLAAVQNVYQSTAGCSSTVPFNATQLYFTEAVGNVRRVYEGGSVTGFMTLGNLVVQPFWDVNVAKAFSNDIRIDNPYSITISGNQLPNVPLQRGGIIFDYKAPHSWVEWLADAQYTAKNNQNNLPAYTQFDAAVNTLVRSGSLTFAVNNFTNAYGGIFASSQWSVPYRTINGMPIDTIARPLVPRSYAVTYNTKFGPGAPITASSGVPQMGERRGGGGGGNGFYVGGPGGPEGGPGGPVRTAGPGGGGGFRSLILPLPSSPPAHPLDLTNSEFCTGDGRSSATQLSSELKAYVAQIEAAKTSAGYPATMPAPQITDATVTYHGMGSTYALTIVPHLQELQHGQLASALLANEKTQSGGTASQRSGVMVRVRGFIGCLQMHVAQQDDVTSRHLYTPPPTNGFAMGQLYFMPAVGLYVVPRARQQQAGQESFRVYSLPQTPPTNPFEIRTSATECSDDLRGTATEAIGELRAYFASGGRAPSWTITPHEAKSGTWYELQPGDPGVMFAILQCGRVAAAAPSDIVQRGYDGMTPPELNYAKALGLYIIRNIPGPGAPQPGAAAPSPAPPSGP
jgi:hypothetical protein